MITLLDYGAGNLASLEGALEAFGYAYERAETPANAAAESLWLLPGDGHYRAAQSSLLASGWWTALQSRIREDKPLLGICVGLQLLAEGSEEAPEAPGLGVFPGLVRRLGPGVKVPHMGWSMTSRTVAHPAFDPSFAVAQPPGLQASDFRLQVRTTKSTNQCESIRGLEPVACSLKPVSSRQNARSDFKEGSTGWLYFVHSYALEVSGCTIFSAEHGRSFTAVAARGKILGFQPHPEKSGAFGRDLLDQSLRWLGETPLEEK